MCSVPSRPFPLFVSPVITALLFTPLINLTQRPLGNPRLVTLEQHESHSLRRLHTAPEKSALNDCVINTEVFDVLTGHALKPQVSSMFTSFVDGLKKFYITKVRQKRECVSIEFCNN